LCLFTTSLLFLILADIGLGLFLSGSYLALILSGVANGTNFLELLF
jgi:hypothetical protein